VSVKGFDFAWTKPTPQQVKDAGGEFIAGYFSTDISKNLNRNNIGGYLSAGLSVVTVWETSAGRALQGAAAGAWDCHMAESERAATQLPANCVHYFAVDTDTDWASVSAYFESAAGTIGKERVGIYGGIKVCEGAYAAGFRYLWQTIAWSGGNVAKHVSIYQDGETAWGGSADVDFAYGLDYGQSPRPVIPVKPPVPPVVVASEQKEIKMILVSVDKNEVPVGVDWPGVFLLGDDGKLTHVTDVESLAAYVADGVPGPKTISYAEYLTRK
jgi:hypothetical protein